jgi:hypothetical protein
LVKHAKAVTYNEPRKDDGGASKCWGFTGVGLGGMRSLTAGATSCVPAHTVANDERML